MRFERLSVGVAKLQALVENRLPLPSRPNGRPEMAIRYVSLVFDRWRSDLETTSLY
jgi:hypothetical protein